MSYLSLEHKVAKFISRHQLLREDETVLVALSGGLDSMVLLYLLHRLHFKITAAHCNFKLRGEASDADEFACEAICKEMQIPFTSRHFETKVVAEEKKISIQMAARDLRYDWFKQLALSHGYGAIATAHHSNDQAETVLLNLLSGKSIESIRGIPVRNNTIIRPLLQCTKEELRQYALEKNIRWREDSSNAENHYKRNLLRNEIMPLLRQINPSVEEQLSRLAERMADWNLLAEEGISSKIAAIVEEEKDFLRIHVQRLMDHPAKKMLLWKLLSPYGFDGAVIEDMTTQPLESGKIFLSASYTLTVDRDSFLLEKTIETATAPYVLIPEGNECIILPNGVLHLSFHENKISREQLLNNNNAFLDAGLVQFPLEVRSWEEGDSFYPLGMDHPKKLSDYFIDKKIPVPEKHKKLLVTHGRDILWIIGDRIDQRYRITENTTRVLILHWQPDEHEPPFH
ncbi:MAG: tRNA lysidine(34) synthetase TilS [Bacteroidetes bacterium]|nr:tRNA lysidine(34) synthetase TilS [Bacteroidota bacterium]